MPKPLCIRSAIAFACIAASMTAAADIRYGVKPLPESRQVEVTVAIPMTSAEVQVQMPRWMPGYYVLESYASRMADLAATDTEGKPIQLASVDDSTWKIAAPKNSAVTVKYKVPLEYVKETGHFSGALTYLYVVGRKDEKCLLHLDLAPGTRVAVGLDGSGFDYTAPNYDVLADNSVTFGAFRSASYIAAGKPHTVAVRGSGAAEIDLDMLTTDCRTISAIETDFFGGAPYSKYVWQFVVHTGFGPTYGIEHLTSAEISLSTKLDAGTDSLIAHEYFHLWNVKRIRSRSLGPFDYTKLPKTGALWWLEGVTDYFAQSLIRRYGCTTDLEYFHDIEADLRGLRSNPAHLTVSPYDSSFKVDQTNDGRGNSDGYGVSYYEAGFLVGLCLDIELLDATDGKRSLDDVELALWKLCRDGKPGFEEHEIRKQLIEFGGPKFGEVYDRLVLKAGDLPVAEELANVGLKLVPGANGALTIHAADVVDERQAELRTVWLAKHRPHGR